MGLFCWCALGEFPLHGLVAPCKLGCCFHFLHNDRVLHKGMQCSGEDGVPAMERLPKRLTADVNEMNGSEQSTVC